MRCTARQHVACIVEMDDLLETVEVTICQYALTKSDEGRLSTLRGVGTLNLPRFCDANDFQRASMEDG
jgi:hypothetical protein